MDLSQNCCDACKEDAMRGGGQLAMHIASACGHDIFWSQGLTYCESCAQAQNVCAMCGLSLQPSEEAEENETDCEFTPEGLGCGTLEGE